MPAKEAGAVVNLHAAEINSGSTCRFHQNTCTVLLILSFISHSLHTLLFLFPFTNCLFCFVLFFYVCYYFLFIYLFLFVMIIIFCFIFL